MYPARRIPWCPDRSMALSQKAALFSGSDMGLKNQNTHAYCSSPQMDDFLWTRNMKIDDILRDDYFSYKYLF